MKRLNFGSQLLLKHLPIVLVLAATAVAALAADKSVSLYQRFEQSFESAASYANPAQEASLVATLTAPSGEKLKVPGFWDGGKTWRIRFAPTQTGKWKFETTCSDASNKGLHQKSGEFTVTASSGASSLARHGPITVSADGRYLAHHDGTPFLWVGDTAWNGPLLSSTTEWDQYLKERSRQFLDAWGAGAGAARGDGGGAARGGAAGGAGGAGADVGAAMEPEKRGMAGARGGPGAGAGGAGAGGGAGGRAAETAPPTAGEAAVAAPAAAFTGNTLLHTAQRARTPPAGTLPGSTRYTVSHDGQVTFI